MVRGSSERYCAQGAVPLVNVEGSARECGRWLGHSWAESLRRAAADRPARSLPWWKDRRFKNLVDQLAPHLPPLYRGLAHGAGVSENHVGTRAPIADEGCTSFAIQPPAALDRQPISGQTKDGSVCRIHQRQVLRLKMTDAPSALTVTEAGLVFGFGFVAGGCAIFRNSLWAGAGTGQLPFAAWGLLALHCPTVEQVVKLTKDYGVRKGFHTTVADEYGGVVGIEMTAAGVAFLKPVRGIYTHANAVVGDRKAVRHERTKPPFTRADSVHRQRRLAQMLREHRGRMTAQLAFNALADHDGYPVSICRHQSAAATTSAAIVAEPTRRRLHVCRGAPCQNWSQTYCL